MECQSVVGMDGDSEELVVSIKKHIIGGKSKYFVGRRRDDDGETTWEPLLDKKIIKEFERDAASIVAVMTGGNKKNIMPAISHDILKKWIPLGIGGNGDGASGSKSKMTAVMAKRPEKKSKVKKALPAPTPVAELMDRLEIKAEEVRQEESSKKTIFPHVLPEKPKFMLLLDNEDDDERAEVIITRFGGLVSDLPYFDKDCDALVTNYFLPDEEVMGCMVSGKFILRMEYVEKSFEAGQFLPIGEEFIWHEGNTENQEIQGLAKISCDWLKVVLTDATKKPLAGRKVYYHHKDDKLKARYSRLVVAAGGQLVTSVKNATDVYSLEKNLSLPKGVVQQEPRRLNDLFWNGPVKDQIDQGSDK